MPTVPVTGTGFDGEFATMTLAVGVAAVAFTGPAISITKSTTTEITDADANRIAMAPSMFTLPCVPPLADRRSRTMNSFEPTRATVWGIEDWGSRREIDC